MNRLKNWFTRINPLLIDLPILLFSAILPIWKTGILGIIDGTDADFPLAPLSNLHSSLSVWYDKVTMGYDISSAFLSQIPFYGILASLNTLGLSIGAIERIWYVAGIFLAGLSMYLLTRNILRGKHHFASLLAGLFYIFNPIMGLYVSQGEHIAIFSYAFIPLVFLLGKLGVENKKPIYALYIGIVSVFMAITNMPSFVVHMLPLYFWLLYEIATGKNRKNVAKFTILSIVYVVVLNIWWLVPAVLGLGGSSQIGDINRLWLFTWKLISQAATPINLLLVRGVPAPTSGPLCAIAILVSITLIYSIIRIIGRNTSPERKKMIWFLLILLIVSFVLAAGRNSVFGKPIQFFMMKIPILQMFRNPYRFAIWTIFSYCVLFSFAADEILAFFKKSYAKIIFVSLMLALVFIGEYPMITGDMKQSIKPVTIPQEYYEAADWLKNQGEGRILILPQEEWLSKFTWAYYDMPDFTRYLFNKPIVRDYPENRLAFSHSVDMMTIAYDEINHAGLGVHLDRILALMGVDTLMVRGDSESFLRTINSKETIEKNLSTQENIGLERKIGGLDFYKSGTNLPQIYTTTDIHMSDINIDRQGGQTESLDGYLGNIDFTKQPVIFFTPEAKDFNMPSSLADLNISGKSPETIFSKISPTKYSVQVKNANSPYILTFLASYNKNWKVTINKNGKTQKIDEGQHYLANGYANGWYVREQGDYTMTIEYSAQKVFSILAICSILIAAGSFIYFKFFYEKTR
ncbi:MAG: alpha-(1-_3)-arabinofuranosyltransferase family protein [Patescibacteria group bacterium]|jgi:hypothetical protein